MIQMDKTILSSLVILILASTSVIAGGMQDNPGVALNFLFNEVVDMHAQLTGMNENEQLLQYLAVQHLIESYGVINARYEWVGKHDLARYASIVKDGIAELKKPVVLQIEEEAGGSTTTVTDIAALPFSVNVQPGGGGGQSGGDKLLIMDTVLFAILSVEDEVLKNTFFELYPEYQIAYEDLTNWNDEKPWPNGVSFVNIISEEQSLPDFDILDSILMRGSQVVLPKIMTLGDVQAEYQPEILLQGVDIFKLTETGQSLEFDLENLKAASDLIFQGAF